MNLRTPNLMVIKNGTKYHSTSSFGTILAIIGALIATVIVVVAMVVFVRKRTARRHYSSSSTFNRKDRTKQKSAVTAKSASLKEATTTHRSITEMLKLAKSTTTDESFNRFWSNSSIG